MLGICNTVENYVSQKTYYLRNYSRIFFSSLCIRIRIAFMGKLYHITFDTQIYELVK